MGLIGASDLVEASVNLLLFNGKYSNSIYPLPGTYDVFIGILKRVVDEFGGDIVSFYCRGGFLILWDQTLIEVII